MRAHGRTHVAVALRGLSPSPTVMLALHDPHRVPSLLPLPKISLRINSASLPRNAASAEINLDLRTTDLAILALLLSKIPINRIRRDAIGIHNGMNSIHNLRIMQCLMRTKLDIGFGEICLQFLHVAVRDFNSGKTFHFPVEREHQAGTVGTGVLPAVGTETFEGADDAGFVDVDEGFAAVLAFFGVLVVAAVVEGGSWGQAVDFSFVGLEIGEVGDALEAVEIEHLVGANLYLGVIAAQGMGRVAS